MRIKPAVRHRKEGAPVGVSSCEALNSATRAAIALRAEPSYALISSLKSLSWCIISDLKQILAL